MILLRLLLGVGWALACGYLLVSLLVGVAGRRSPAAWLVACLAPGVGLGLASLNYFLWQLVSPEGKRYFLLASEGLILLALAGMYVWRRPGPLAFPAQPVPFDPGQPWRAFLKAAFYIALGLAVVVFLLGVGMFPLGTRDAWSIWNLDARYLYQGGSAWTNLFSAHQFNPDYPLLLPASVARLWNYAGALTPLGPILLAFIFTFGTVGLLAAGVAGLRGAAAAHLGGLVLLSASAFLVQGPSQVADIPVGYYMLGAALVFVVYDQLRRDHAEQALPGWVALAGILSGLAAWTKNEGLLFLVALFAARLLAHLLHPGRGEFRRELGAFLAGLLPVLVFVLYFKLALAPPGNMLAGQGQSTLDRLGESWRYGLILKSFLAQTYQPLARRFTPFLLLPALLLILGAGRSRLPGRAWVTLAILAVALPAGYFIVYLATPLDLAWQLQTSLFRVALQLWPLLVLLTVLVVRLGGER